MTDINVLCPACQHAFSVEAVYAGCVRRCPSCDAKVPVGEDATADGPAFYDPGPTERRVPKLLKVMGIFYIVVGILVIHFTESFAFLIVGIVFLVFIGYGLLTGRKWAVGIIIFGACMSIIKIVSALGTGDTSTVLRGIFKLLVLQLPIIITAVLNWDELD